ncbi:MAG: MATE family efflux transporter [Lachnospiraceae bacterium]|nr:MATE family efflux transporter [Lachnospiraceae bacterium]
MTAANTKDMSQETPLKLILNFSIPLLFGMLFQQIYNIVDAIIVSHFLGVKALAGVGSTGSINFLILGFCGGLCNGFALPVAQSFGAKDENSLRKFVGNSAVLAVFFALIITLTTTALSRNILEWMGTPADIIDLAHDYLIIVFWGIPALMLYNTLAGYIRALGNSVIPLVFLIFSTCLNIVLDLFWILVLKAGVSGAALATVISQGISGILCLLYIRKHIKILCLKRSDLKLHPRYVKPLLRMGLPMGIQYSITAIGSVILQTAVNSLGSTAVASMTAGGKISMFVVCPFDALGSTMATYAGQNVGAGKLSRLGKGLKTSLLLGCVYSVIIFGILSLFSGNLLYLFVSSSEKLVISQAKTFLFYNSLFYVLLCLVNCIRFTIQGMGFSGFAVFAGFAEMIARALIGLIFIPAFGYTAACLASPAAWVLADAFLIPAYFYAKKQLYRKQSSL